MGFSRNLLLAIAASTYVTQTALAIDDDECSGTLDEIREKRLEFNSTKTAAFEPTPGDPWLFTLGLSDWRKEGFMWGDYESSQHIETFLSVPNGIANGERANETRVCIYMMDGQNATANDGNKSGHSCNGILSDECQKALRSIKRPADGTCPDPPVSVKETCNQYVLYQSATPQVYDNANCSTPALPGVSLPGGYKTFPVMGTGLFPSDNPIDSYELYGLRVRQPIPFLFTMEFYNNKTLTTATELLCVAPNEVMKGSRKPEGDFPPNAASGLDTKGAVMLAIGVWSVMGLLLG
ncbi:hypothetical protein N0V84_006458 [Fusarium piperis]|uniref:Uncharacterized protein n=1 Tax=Fusarium piperis TaxID=1435070 RepID=A0A9W8WC01_9HYPO|nr:hypothetical protein N0V84_006458 [Fusarium piperis]